MFDQAGTEFAALERVAHILVDETRREIPQIASGPDEELRHFWAGEEVIKLSSPGPCRRGQSRKPASGSQASREVRQADMASNGQEAIEKADALPYDLVFMDCHMPVLDGYEATAEIRRRQRPNHIMRIIAITAEATVSAREQCMQAGMDDFITKPMSPGSLRLMIEKWAPRVESEFVAS